MTTEDKYDLIERYLEQQLSSEELIAFEEKLKQDTSLQEEVALHRLAAETLKGEKIHQLRNLLNQTDQEWQSEPNIKNAKVINFNIRRLLAIAAIALALVVAWQLFNPNNTPSSEALFADNFQPYQMILNQRNLSKEDKIELLNDAISAYNKGDFKSSAALFNELNSTYANNTTFSLYQAVSELATGNYDKAIPILETLITSSDVLFVEQSKWYLALAYLQKGDLDKAKKMLNAIQAGEFKYQDAQKILQNLE